MAEQVPEQPLGVGLTSTPGGGWVPVPDPTTLTTLQLRRELAGMRELLELQIVALKELMTRRADDSDKAVAAAFDAAKEAVTKAESAAEKRFDSVNEFRAQQADLIAGFISRREYESAHQAVIAATEEVRHRLEELATVVVPRSETDAWRNALTEKSDIATSRNYEAIHRLESRFDSLQGQLLGAGTERTEKRAETTSTTNSVMPILVVVSIIVAIAAVIVSIVLHK